MGWLEDYLTKTAAGQSALLQAAKQGVPPPRTALGFPMAPGAEENEPQPPGPPGESSVHNAVHLGQGLRAGTIGGAQTSTPFERYSTMRHGRLMEAHDYGGGDVKYFARKNPALLEAAAKLATSRQLKAGRNAQAAAVAAMSPEDQERIRRLLGV